MEQALLLPRDMDELQNFKKHKLFLFVKRDLALVKPPSTCSFISATSLPQSCHFSYTYSLIPVLIICAQATQTAHVAEEWVDQALHDQKEEESKRYAAQKSLAQTDKKLKETLVKLTKCDKARKSAEASIESKERQAREQLLHLREAESQLAIARTNISELKKKLSQKNEEMSKVEQSAYKQKETESHLKSQIPMVCPSFCLQTQVKALNATGVDPSSELRNLEKAFYPPAIRACPTTQPPVNTSGPTQMSSTENPLPQFSTTAHCPCQIQIN